MIFFTSLRYAQNDNSLQLLGLAFGGWLAASPPTTPTLTLS